MILMVKLIIFQQQLGYQGQKKVPALTPCSSAVIQICKTDQPSFITHSKVCCDDFLPYLSLECSLWGCRVTHRLPPPPAVVQLLSRAQAERGVEDGVVHGVTHNAVGLWVEALETQQSNGSRVR